MAFANLPARGERSAPTFDESQPEELERYFADLQTLLDRFGVVDENERKLAALRYLKIRTEGLWKTTSAWLDPTKSYAEFKAEVFKLYLGASGDRTYTIQDLDMVIGQYARVGILTSADLGNYYRQFLLISRYLISKGRMSTHEQSRSFFRGLQPDLEVRVRQRLQQKFVDHFPDDPYELSAVYEAVSYVLMGSAAMGTVQVQPAQASPPDPNAIKIEALTQAVTSLGEMVKTVVQAQTVGARQRSTGAAAAGVSASGGSNCNFCGGSGHFIRECKTVAEYIKAGKCKKSTANGKVVLPSGAEVPRGVPGSWLRNHVDEWHRTNPGQLAAQMLFEVMAEATALLNDAAGQAFISYPARYVNQFPGVSPESFALKQQPRPRPEVVISTQPPCNSGRIVSTEHAGGADSEAVPPKLHKDQPPRANQDTSAVKRGQEKGPNCGETQEPAHPYATVPDAINRSVPGPARPAAREPAAGKHEPAYSTTAKIHDPRVADMVYERAMETPITVTQRELLSLAPEVRARVADVTVKKGVPRDTVPVAQAMIEEVTNDDEPSPHSQRLVQATHMPAAFTAARVPPADATVITDPYEAYLCEHKHGEPDIVAAESNVLRTILPVIDGQDRVEAILDPGCQIVAMSEEVSNVLALPYDPTVRLNMVSANGGIDQSLGLAHNVPFLVGDIVLYLQVHVLCAPAYDILLGRPFDILTQSVVRNFSDENQTVTILDPNTGCKATVPTIQRGSFCFAERCARKCPVHSADF